MLAGPKRGPFGTVLLLLTHRILRCEASLAHRKPYQFCCATQNHFAESVLVQRDVFFSSTLRPDMLARLLGFALTGSLVQSVSRTSPVVSAQCQGFSCRSIARCASRGPRANCGRESLTSSTRSTATITGCGFRAHLLLLRQAHIRDLRPKIGGTR